MPLAFTLSIIAAYLLGAIPSGILIARALGRDDPRTTGSGHTGAMNALRAAGKIAGVLTFLADVAKAILAIELARYLTAGDAWAMAFAAIAAVIGHILPVYTRFRGGMGLAVGIGALVIFAPLALAAIIAAWFPLKFFLARAPYASMAISVLLTPVLFLLGAPAPTLAFGIGAGTLIFARHYFDVTHRAA